MSMDIRMTPISSIVPKAEIIKDWFNYIKKYMGE